MTSRDSIRCSLLASLALTGLSPLAHAVAPVAPSNCVAVAVSATLGIATVGLTWNDNSTNETVWKIQVSANNGAYADLGAVGSSTTATTGNIGVTWPGAALNTTYRFKIIASNGTEVSSVSNVATVGTYDLNGPINFSVTAVDPFNVMMSWEEGSTSEAGFAIERKTGAGAWEYIGSIGSNNLFVIPSNLIAPLDTFVFRIRAFKGSPPTTPGSPKGPSVSDYSNEAAVTGDAYPLVASAAPCQAVINLTWPNIQNETNCQIYYKPADAPSYSLLDVVGPDITTYQVTSPVIEPTKTYSFVLQPLNGANAMGESSVASATVDGITSKTGTSGTPGSPFSHSFTQISGSTIRSRTLTEVPSELSFDDTTGVLSGVFPALGNSTLTYTVTFTNGFNLTQVFHIRVRPPAGPPSVGAVIPAWDGAVGATRDIPLAGTFTDSEAESAVRVGTTLGDMDFILFDAATPATVTNFMSYVSAAKYTDVAFHRSIAGFVIQGGGFKGAGTGSDFNSVATHPPVTNEPGIANVRGTISMAKVGGNPNSATSQFFVSLGDNRANLDYQNGGFTVFGRVAGNGMAVADAISVLPHGSYGLFVDGNTTATPFDDFPMHDSSLPDPMDQTKLVKINSVTSVPTLSYSITGNTDPAVASASIANEQLHLAGLAGGQTTITVTATDLDGLTTSQAVVVTISDTYGTWAARRSFPGGQSAAGENADDDNLTNLQEYALLGDPMVSSQAALPDPGWAGVSPAAQFMTLSFPVRKFTTGLSYVVETNDQLTGVWTPVWSSANDANFSHAEVVSASDQADRTVVTIMDRAALGTRRQRFMRLKVVQD